MIPQKQKLLIILFKTFPECSLLSTVSKKKPIKMIGHNARLRDAMANLTPFIPVLVLITRVIHSCTLHFAVAGGIVYKVIIGKKT